ncbi:MAG: DUF4037 domain-containing protein [Gaiellaceae bacterium]
MRGLELSRRFYVEAVRPILERDYPDFAHAAALIGYGSDVLGFDDETSRDHEWGPRVQLFVRDAARRDEIEERLARELPTTFAGFSTNFGPTDEPGTKRLAPVDAGPVAHRVQVLSLSEYVRERIGVDPLAGFSMRDWLVTPAQRLLELTAGEVFVDPIGDVTRLRELLAFYPRDIWLYVMAGHWQQISEYEHFVGRTGSRGDDLGSRILTAALVRDLMHLALLQERRYPPYAKWLGAAYAMLSRPELRALEGALGAADWQTREHALCEAYEAVARRHNELGITATVDPRVRPFWGRPFTVLFAERFVDALLAAIEDPDVRALGHPVGAIDAASDNTALRARPRLWRRLGLYDRT